VDPTARKNMPSFYGYIPNGGSRTAIFGFMMLNSALLLLIRSFSAAMLMLVNKRYLVVYLAGDMALYLLLKVARGDFHYWIPVDGALGLFVSLLMRLSVKAITDFTCVIQFRHPGELGGLYWSANMFTAVAASFVCVWVGGGGRAEWALVGAMSGAWVLTFGLFLLVMQKEYRGTFFSAMTGKEFIMNIFLMHKDDKAKGVILSRNKRLWKGIRGEVKEWVREGWWRWEANRPEWFTESWIAKVPPDMVPSEAQQAAKDIRASARRRSSFMMIAPQDKRSVHLMS